MDAIDYVTVDMDIIDSIYMQLTKGKVVPSEWRDIMFPVAHKVTPPSNCLMSCVLGSLCSVPKKGVPPCRSYLFWPPTKKHECQMF
jgi:hypothetical protein